MRKHDYIHEKNIDDFLIFFTFVSSVLVDTLVLKEGKVFLWTYKGGDETSVFL